MSAEIYSLIFYFEPLCETNNKFLPNSKGIHHSSNYMILFEIFIIQIQFLFNREKKDSKFKSMNFSLFF